MEKRGSLEAVEIHVLESIHVVIITRSGFLGGDLDRGFVVLRLIVLRVDRIVSLASHIKGAHGAAAAGQGSACSAAASL